MPRATLLLYEQYRLLFTLGDSPNLMAYTLAKRGEAVEQPEYRTRKGLHNKAQDNMHIGQLSGACTALETLAAQYSC